MEIRLLKYFLMTAREENITRAAQLLHVTQPTLSRQLMQLEEELGVQLFHRSNHSIVLTEDGMLLKRRAQELIDLADKTVRELSQREEILNGEIAVGSGELRSMGLLSELLAGFHQEHPQVCYDIYSGNADNIKERLEQGTLDLGLLLEPVEIARYEFLRMPVRESWGVLVRKDSELAGKPYVRPEDLIRFPLLFTKRELLRRELLNWFGDNSDQMNIVSAYNLIYNAAMMVKNGIGIALCVELESSFENLCFVPLSPSLEFYSVLAWKKNKVHSPAAAAFISYAKEQLKNMV
ncbi:LysR family transcriptional regulator [Clostridium transplantifaecale]|uniref:LysR family transcriptional regulator n=1 Tax=Clostridium transplantifaecale TaxID=2479838 RepID=UPI000F63C9C7|nr:LysR family transcriptional regulator [Clostridium transplantifaecale]